MNDKRHDGSDARPLENEGAGTEQTWGQGEGEHEPTLEPDGSEEQPTTSSGGLATDLGHADQELTRDEEGMDR